MSQNRYKNDSHKTYDDLFGDDFEVVYEEELPPIDVSGKHSEQSYNLDDEDFDDDYLDGSPQDDTDDDRARSTNGRRNNSSRNARNENSSKNRDNEQKAKRRRLAPNVVSPVKKTVQTGAKAVSSVVRLLCKTASLLILAIIIYILATHFWEGLAAYGNPTTAVSEKNYVLGAYAAFATFILLFELLSLIWSFGGPRVARQNGRSYRADTGRGMSAFILTGAGACLARMTAALIPESPLLLTGLKGAVEILGGLASTLIPLCIAGIISCILRRIFSR